MAKAQITGGELATTLEGYAERKAWLRETHGIDIIRAYRRKGTGDVTLVYGTGLAKRPMRPGEEEI